MPKSRDYLGYLLALTLAALTYLLVSNPHTSTSPYVIPAPDGADIRLGRGAITSIAVSPNERLLAIGTAVGVFVYDVRTFEEIWYRLTDSRTISIGFAPDGRLLTGHPDQRGINIWNAHTGEQLATINANSGWEPTLRVSPDGLLIASQPNGPLAVWDIDTLQPVRELPGRGHPNRLSPSGNLLATCDGFSCDIVEITTGNVLYQDAVSTEFLWLYDDIGMTFLHDVPGWYLWDVSLNQIIASMPIRGEGPFRLSPDHHFISTEQDHGKLVIWNLDSGEVEAELEGHIANVQHAIWLSDSRTIITANEAEVVAWDVSGEQKLHSLDGFMDAVFDIAWLPDDSGLGVSLRDGRFLLFDVPEGTRRFAFDTKRWLASGISFHPDGERVVLASTYTLHILSLAEQETPLMWGMDETPLTVRWSPNGKWLATGDLGALVTIWNAENTEKIAQSRESTYPHIGENPANHHTERINNVEWSPDGRLIASADSSKLIIWDAASLTPIHSIQTRYDHGISIPFEGKSIAWSPDGSQLVTASDEGITFWDVLSGQIIETWKAHVQYGYDAVDWSPDGQLIAAAGFDGQIAIWDAATGELLRVLSGHQRGVMRVVWSPDATMLASGAWDGTVIVWGRSTMGR